MKAPITILVSLLGITPIVAEEEDAAAGSLTKAPDPANRVVFDVRIRTEVESYDNQDWVPGADDTYYYQRVIFGTRWHLGPDLDLVASPYHAWVWEKEILSPIDMNRFDFFELGLNWRINDDHTLHLGRQMLDFGSGRLVSSRMGPNVPRTFDAIRHVWTPGQWNIQLFYAREVQAEAGTFDDPVFDDEATLWGVYSTLNLAEKCGFDLYALGTEQRDDRLTFGLRYFGEASNFDWNLEAVGQTGNSIRAGSLASTIAYKFADTRWTPRLGLKTSISSGDDAGTSRNETFSPLYPRGDYFSETATVGPLNHIELHTFLTLDLSPDTTLLLETASLWKTTRDDAVYAVPGYPLRPGNPNGGRFTGQETSVSLTHRFNKQLSMELSGSWFHPGSAVSDAGPAEDMLYGKISFGYTF